MYVYIMREGYDCVEWGVWEVLPSGMLVNSGRVEELESAITFCWIVWCFLCASFGLILVLLSSPSSDFLVLGNLPRGYVVGKPSLGMDVMLGIYTRYNEYLSVWLNVASDCHKLCHKLRVYLDVNPWMMWFLGVGISYLFLRLEKFVIGYHSFWKFHLCEDFWGELLLAWCAECV